MGRAQGYNTRVCWLEAWGITAPIAESPAGPVCPLGRTAPKPQGEQRALETVLEPQGVKAEAWQAL